MYTLQQSTNFSQRVNLEVSYCNTVNNWRKFIDLNILHSRVTSNYLASAMPSLQRKIQQELLLGPGKYIFDDNVHVNTLYVHIIITPYKQENMSLEDNCNFHHLQLHIAVDAWIILWLGRLTVPNGVQHGLFCAGW